MRRTTQGGTTRPGPEGDQGRKWLVEWLIGDRETVTATQALNTTPHLS